MRWGVIASIAASAVGGIVCYLLSNQEEDSKPVEPVAETVAAIAFPEDPMQGFNDQLDIYAKGLDEGKRERFFYWYDRLQEDTFIPWIKPEFAATLDYVGVCLALIFYVINQRQSGLDHPDFDVCLNETKKVYLEIVSRMRHEMTRAYPILRQRRVCNSAMFLLGTILEGQIKTERKVVWADQKSC